MSAESSHSNPARDMQCPVYSVLDTQSLLL